MCTMFASILLDLCVRKTNKKREKKELKFSHFTTSSSRKVRRTLGVALKIVIAKRSVGMHFALLCYATFCKRYHLYLPHPCIGGTTALLDEKDHLELLSSS